MTSFAEEMMQDATELLSEFDERSGANKIMLIQQGAKVWDATEGEYTFPAATETPLTGVAVPYNQSLVNDTTIQSGDIKLTVTSEIEPKSPDKILLDGVQHSIVAITPFAYTGKGKTIAYQIQARR